MYRNSSPTDNRTLEYPPELPGGPVRLRKNYARHGILATALLLGLTLVMTTWFAWRNAEALTDTVSEGQGELYLRAFHNFRSNRHPDQAFQAVLDTYAESGLRAAGRYDAEGNFKVIAGAFDDPIPTAADRGGGRSLTRIGRRYRIIVRLPMGGPPMGPPPDREKPPPGGFPPHKRPPPPPPFDGMRPPPPPFDGMRPPHLENGPLFPAAGFDFSELSFEFEPLLATGLTQRARMTFFLATGVAALLAIAAIVLWRRAEREEALGARLMQAERLASLGTMSAVLAHEIKNPLASLKGNAQLLAESLPADGRSRSQADRVVDAALRLQGLVQNLLDFARGGPIERTEVDPAELLFLAAEDAAPATTLDLDQAPPMWSLDAIRMRQVLENLLRNALQASKHGVVHARVFVESNMLVYIVDDDGPGFPADVLENVFEPFFTTKSRGVGLGLAVARRIVFMHGGTISARNKTNGGAELKVSIPQFEVGRKVAMARILVVDDEEGLREFLSDTLEAAGHTVERAVDGEVAYRILASRAFHVLVTDLKMPGIDGMELVRRTRREQPEMEVVVLTAHGSVAGAVEAMKLGAFDYLEKPIPSPAALRLVVDRALERRGLHAIEEHVAENSAPPRLGYGSRAMVDVESALRKVALTDATVLLLGESGTGKEVAARFLHGHSKRSRGPFVAVNCATLSEQLLESELFGHEKGAFSGAIAKKRGKLELAEGGTFFLDEIGEMRLELQTKLLRVLQERRFERVGGTCSIDVDARFIAATNRDLTSEIQTGRFREDLYHRLAVFPVRMPPLRERPEDVSHLADVLLGRIARDLGRPGLSLDEGARGAIVAAEFPGNVRELRNALERAAILAESTRLTVEDIARVLSGRGHDKPIPTINVADAPTMEEAEQTAIRRALAQSSGNRKKAAEHLGIGLRTLYEKLKKYGIR